MFDQKRAARVGAKKLRQRMESRIAKKSLSRMYYNPDDDLIIYSEERDSSIDDEQRDRELNDLVDYNKDPNYR